MKEFKTIVYDPAQAKKELRELDKHARHRPGNASRV